MDLTARIARRFTAETLTKQWLMAVRRGWQSLMKPSIASYDDVSRALGKLHTFANNLQDQVLNVRRGPYTSPSSMTQGEELRAAFKELIAQIEDAGSSVRHWRECYEGKALGDCRKDGEHMLALYKSNFDGATSRSKRQRGKGGLSRDASLTEFLDDVLKILYEDAKRIREHDEKNPGEELGVKEDAFKEFQLGRAKIIITDTKTNGSAVIKYTALMQKAYADLKRWGFDKLWYGVILITLGDFEKLSPELKAEYERAGYADLDGRAGTYHSGADVVKLTAPPTEYFVTTVIHEMGHRYWFKFMTSEKRARFEMVVEGTYSKAHAVLLNEHLLSEDERIAIVKAWKKLDSGREPDVGEKKLIEEKYQALGLRAGVPLVSQYAKSSIAEAFAEVFEKYVSGSSLSRPQIESFRSVLAFDPALEWKLEDSINHL